MGLMINTLTAAPTMVSQLQRMQRQMRTIEAASAGAKSLAPTVSKDAFEQGIKNAPVFAPGGTSEVDNLRQVEHKDNVGAFADMLKNAFENVNNLQNESNSMQTRFDLGDRSVTLSDVMLATQKASISFEATVQIRNKMIEAYRTISQMQV